MRAEYPRLKAVDLVVDAMDPVEGNLDGVRRLLED
jgi:hypothetical protein